MKYQCPVNFLGVLVFNFVVKHNSPPYPKIFIWEGLLKYAIISSAKEEAMSLPFMNFKEYAKGGEVMAYR